MGMGLRLALAGKSCVSVASVGPRECGVGKRLVGLSLAHGNSKNFNSTLQTSEK